MPISSLLRYRPIGKANKLTEDLLGIPVNTPMFAADLDKIATLKKKQKIANVTNYTDLEIIRKAMEEQAKLNKPKDKTPKTAADRLKLANAPKGPAITVPVSQFK